MMAVCRSIVLSDRWPSAGSARSFPGPQVGLCEAGHCGPQRLRDTVQATLAASGGESFGLVKG